MWKKLNELRLSNVCHEANLIFETNQFCRLRVYDVFVGRCTIHIRHIYTTLQCFLPLSSLVERMCLRSLGWRMTRGSLLMAGGLRVASMQKFLRRL